MRAGQKGLRAAGSRARAQPEPIPRLKIINNKNPPPASAVPASSSSSSASMPPPRGNRIIEHLNKDVRVRTKDGWYEGRFRAFDKHMNLILGAAMEVRHVKARGNKVKGEDGAAAAASVRRETRQLGMIVLRGEFVVSVIVIGQGSAKPRPEAGSAAGGAGDASFSSSASSALRPRRIDPSAGRRREDCVSSSVASERDRDRTTPPPPPSRPSSSSSSAAGPPPRRGESPPPLRPELKKEPGCKTQ